MRKLLSLGLGLAIGAAIGLTVAYLYSPSSGEDLRENLKTGYKDTLKEAKLASEQRRRQLEADFARRRRG